MKTILSERKLAFILFVIVLIIFSLAHEDSKKMEKVYIGLNSPTARILALEQPITKISLSGTRNQ